MYRVYLALLLSLLLSGCATYLRLPAPRHGESVKLSYSVTQDVTESATTPATNSASCPPYIPPPHPKPPPLPSFTDRERSDPDHLNRRLGDYILALRNYIREVESQEDKAYLAYKKICKGIP